MSTSQLRETVREVGVERTAMAAALLLVIAEERLAAEDPASLLYAALSGVLRRDVVGLDELLIGATVAARDRRPDAVLAVTADLVQTEDDLARALAVELQLAARDAYEQTEAFARQLEGL